MMVQVCLLFSVQYYDEFIDLYLQNMVDREEAMNLTMMIMNDNFQLSFALRTLFYLI